MTYSKERAASISKSDIKYIPAGIIENVVLKSVKTEVSPNGNQFLEIVFEKDGATLTHTEWKPTLGGFVTTEEQLQTKWINSILVCCRYLTVTIKMKSLTLMEKALNSLLSGLLIC